jgi:hypothetical protein
MGAHEGVSGEGGSSFSPSPTHCLDLQINKVFREESQLAKLEKVWRP